MTTNEFNEKYKNYLKKGHYGLDISIPEVIEYLDKEFQSLIKIPEFQYSQIKLKFGRARFYCTPYHIDNNTIEDNINNIFINAIKKEAIETPRKDNQD